MSEKAPKKATVRKVKKPVESIKPIESKEPDEPFTLTPKESPAPKNSKRVNLWVSADLHKRLRLLSISDDDPNLVVTIQKACEVYLTMSEEKNRKS